MSEVKRKYIVVEYTCGEVVSHTVKGATVMDVAARHKAKRDWLEAKSDWYEEDTSEVLAIVKVAEGEHDNKLMIEKLLAQMEWEVLEQRHE